MKPDGALRLHIEPIGQKEAAEFIAKHHRTHPKAPPGAKFCISVVDESGAMRGCAWVGRPVSRVLDDGFTIEVNRTATDGCPNANSALYAAVRRIGTAMGYRRLITYNQGDETGASLKAAGLRQIRQLEPRKSWAQSSVKLRAIRDPRGTGGVNRGLWSVAL